MQALVLLGCPVGAVGLRPFLSDAERAPPAARRAFAAAEAFHAGRAPVVVASGGRTWHGRVEADELADALAALGVPPDRVIRERCSFSTRENALYTARILERRGALRAVIVTCAWHLPRAERAFRDVGVEVEGIGVPLPARATRARRAYVRVRERIATWLDR